ncbi:hypothetical protein BDL97_15G045900 [Sphagnum fallax]|jgi:cytokinin trans-hydroxylase|nr:hypothetical protein BDL97_15G045900 [Sphagnum fallax]
MEIYLGDHQIWSTLSTSLLTVLLMWVAYIVVGMVDKFVITPMRIKRIMNRQGVKGPYSHLFLGNMPEFIALAKAEEEKDMKTGDYDIVSHILPFYVQNCQAYGKSYLWWFGWEPRMTITDLDLIKQVLTNKDHVFTKSQIMVRSTKPVIGKGLVTTNGEEWALHRRIVNPAFHHENLKEMVVTMEKSASSMVDEWEKKVKDGGGHVELEVGAYMTHVTADIISRTAFGSNYEKGKKVFEQQVALINLLGQRRRQRFGAMPGYSFFPTPLNIKIILTQIGISSSLRKIIQSRKDMAKMAKNTSYGNDLLGLMLSATTEETTIKGGKVHFGMKALMDNCKTFFIAGHETTATLLTWAMMLLASHTTWQERAREEIIKVCGHGDHAIDANMFNKLKTLTMILNETLRLFSPISSQNREASMDTKLGDLHIPKGLNIHIPRLAIHHDPEFWGTDVHEFKPERFINGITNASKNPFAFMPFSFGPRFCVGQGFALEEAKLVLVLVLQRFRFHLSPNYRHAPYDKVTIRPKYGVPVILECL